MITVKYKSTLACIYCDYHPITSLSTYEKAVEPSSGDIIICPICFGVAVFEVTCTKRKPKAYEFTPSQQLEINDAITKYKQRGL